LQSPLRGEHQDRFAGYTLRDEIAHPLNTNCGFARARWTRDEETRVKGRFNDLTLKQAKGRHAARVQDGEYFVNEKDRVAPSRSLIHSEKTCFAVDTIPCTHV
jgi:hypothetical protein